MGCHFLLHGIFLAQGSNPGPLHCKLILYHLSHQESLPGGGARVQMQTHLRVHGNSAIAYLGPKRSSGVSSAAQKAGPSFPLPLPAPPASVTSDSDAVSPWVPVLASGSFQSKAVSFPTFLGGSLGGEDLLEEGMVNHSSILACRIPWTEKPGRLQSMGSDMTEQLNSNSALQQVCSQSRFPNRDKDTAPCG